VNLTILTSAISAAIAGAAGFWLAWQLQAGNITQLKLEHANERITQGRAARVVADRQPQCAGQRHHVAWPPPAQPRRFARQ
jgi:hypothetical protein